MNDKHLKKNGRCQIRKLLNFDIKVFFFVCVSDMVHLFVFSICTLIFVLFMFGLYCNWYMYQYMPLYGI
jgi:hypothetical protein